MWFRKHTRDDFTDKVAVITGGSRGIGFVTAQLFLEYGAHVGICAKDPARLSAAKEHLSSMGKVEAWAVDVQNADAVEHFIDKVRARFGRVDILVNNAGRVWTGRFIDQDLQSINEIIEVNIKGVLYATHAVLPIMTQQKNGVIINVSSGAGLTGFPDLVTYCTSKFAVVGFTESLDQEVREYGIRVYSLCPGRVATDMQKEVSGQKIGLSPKKVAKQILNLAGGVKSFSYG